MSGQKIIEALRKSVDSDVARSSVVQVIHAWIREDAPLTIKMRMLPEDVSKLADRLVAALPRLNGGSDPL